MNIKLLYFVLKLYVCAPLKVDLLKFNLMNTYEEILQKDM